MTKQRPSWSPYGFQRLTCIAIVGAGYCVIAADSRMSTEYNILTRDCSKICKLADKSLMASSTVLVDVRALQKLLAARHLSYQHQHNKQMSCTAMGCVFTYDAVGSYKKVSYSSQGSGAKLITPFLDNQLKSPSPLLLPAQGDKLEIVTLNTEGIRRESMELRN
ncbi:hypothetical protein Nepgr_019075 [Nepenthes gracilis]|uniref:Proteasome subunit beta n=1 Tax=Nepenthes gracilis TaxID=150966 RepID=A0AAD3XUN2_NEPGR|nr:hypothetical protein Nepgr_019075 [Nepenthes gracilis]